MQLVSGKVTTSSNEPSGSVKTGNFLTG